MEKKHRPVLSGIVLFIALINLGIYGYPYFYDYVLNAKSFSFHVVLQEYLKEQEIKSISISKSEEDTKKESGFVFLKDEQEINLFIKSLSEIQVRGIYSSTYRNPMYLIFIKSEVNGVTKIILSLKISENGTIAMSKSYEPEKFYTISDESVIDKLKFLEQAMKTKAHDKENKG
ncbi:hypothetical protein E2R60_24795 [Paenibacillus dendritiformis]|uniref:hypothetical protein n=1 Tax=Paenibacillus dendritiformis TaxID=130049 RepID=UPI00105A9922|nr:hypothetical protein [Paenibacillus dendritiformis]TDL49239.1 hypothetical protein E2R60_24795 [Paenibacillus dendritiformis]